MENTEIVWRKNQPTSTAPILRRESFGRKISEDRDDSYPASKYAVEMIESMGEAVVVQSAGFDPTVAEFTSKRGPG